MAAATLAWAHGSTLATAIEARAERFRQVGVRQVMDCLRARNRFSVDSSNLARRAERQGTSAAAVSSRGPPSNREASVSHQEIFAAKASLALRAPRCRWSWRGAARSLVGGGGSPRPRPFRAGTSRVDEPGPQAAVTVAFGMSVVAVSTFSRSRPPCVGSCSKLFLLAWVIPSGKCRRRGRARDASREQPFTRYLVGELKAAHLAGREVGFFRGAHGQPAPGSCVGLPRSSAAPRSKRAASFIANSCAQNVRHDAAARDDAVRPCSRAT